jgi:tetratricopeptide (TPR) repeat protein
LQIELQLGNQARQATCLMNIGAIYFQTAKFDDALTYQQRAVDVLQKLKLPSDLAMNLGNLGLTYATIGQFDQAINIYLQGLEQARKTSDKTMISAISDNLADLFAAQGRLGAALSAEQDALTNAQQLERESGALLAEIQADYASILNRLGRSQEAEKILDGSLSAVRSAHNDALTAKVLNFQGEGFYYRGDFRSAQPLFARSQQSAEKAKDRIKVLTARFNLARLSVEEGHAAAAVNTLKRLYSEANSLGVKFIATQCSVALGKGFLKAGDYSHAQDELQSAVRKSDDLGMKSLLPEAHYLLSQTLRKRGATAEADRHLQQAAQLVEEMRQESHTDALLQRPDLKVILEDSKKQKGT